MITAANGVIHNNGARMFSEVKFVLCNLSGDMTYYQTQKVNRIVNKQKGLTIFAVKTKITQQV